LKKLAGNHEQVANVLCAQVNLASYSQQDGMGRVWLIGAVVCLLAPAGLIVR